MILPQKIRGLPMWIIRHNMSAFGMTKWIGYVDSKKPNDLVCVIHPVMTFVGMNLDTVTRIQRILGRTHLNGGNAFQNIDELLAVMRIHFQIFFCCVGKWKQGKNSWKKIEGRNIVA